MESKKNAKQCRYKLGGKRIMQLYDSTAVFISAA